MIDSIEELTGEGSEQTDKSNELSGSRQGPTPSQEDSPTPVGSKPQTNEQKENSPVEKSVEQKNKKKKSPSKASSSKAAMKGNNVRAKQPIQLSSEGRSTYSRRGGMIHLRDNVVITQGDLKLRSNEAKVFVDEAEKDDTVRKVEVIGQVKITKSDADATKRVTARGKTATFLNDSQKIILQGNARLWRGGHLIRGKQITYDIVTGLITVDEAVGVVQPGEEP